MGLGLVEAQRLLALWRPKARPVVLGKGWLREIRQVHREGIVRKDGVVERVIFLLLGFLAFCQHPPSIHPRNVGAKGTLGELAFVCR